MIYIFSVTNPLYDIIALFYFILIDQIVLNNKFSLIIILLNIG